MPLASGTIDIPQSHLSEPWPCIVPHIIQLDDHRRCSKACALLQCYKSNHLPSLQAAGWLSRRMPLGHHSRSACYSAAMRSSSVQISGMVALLFGSTWRHRSTTKLHSSSSNRGARPVPRDARAASTHIHASNLLKESLLLCGILTAAQPGHSCKHGKYGPASELGACTASYGPLVRQTGIHDANWHA